MIRKIFDWIAFDGLLHITSYASIAMLLLYITDMYWISQGVAIFLGLVKDFLDKFVQCDNNWKQVAHDQLCNGLGFVIVTAAYLIKTTL